MLSRVEICTLIKSLNIIRADLSMTCQCCQTLTDMQIIYHFQGLPVCTIDHVDSIC